MLFRSDDAEDVEDAKMGSSPPSGKAERDLIIDEPDVTSSPMHNPFAPEATVRSKKKKNKNKKSKNKNASHKKAPKEPAEGEGSPDGTESAKKKAKKHKKKHVAPFSLQS